MDYLYGFSMDSLWISYGLLMILVTSMSNVHGGFYRRTLAFRPGQRNAGGLPVPSRPWPSPVGKQMIHNAFIDYEGMNR